MSHFTRCQALKLPKARATGINRTTRALSKPRRSPRRLSLFGHLLSQAEWPHVRPNFLDVGQTLRFRSCLSHAGPTERVLTVRRPNGILFFVIHYDVIDGRIFSLFTHLFLTPRKFVIMR